MLDLFYNYFFQYVFGETDFGHYTFQIGNNLIAGDDYLAWTCAIICTILVFVVCCLFVWKLTKIVGRLFTGR